MPKRHELVLGFLFATAIWAVVLGLQSDPSAYYQVCETNQYTDKESCTPHHVPYVVLWYVGHWFDKASAVITAFATAAVAWFTWTLWRTSKAQGDLTQQSINLARDEFLSTHRPKIRLKHTWIVGDKFAWRVGGPLEINLDWVNWGDGPAKITWVVFQTIVLKKGERLPQRPPFNEAPDDQPLGSSHFWCGVTLNPGITFPRTVCDGTILDTQEVVEIVHGRKELYLIGSIQYWDDAGARGTAFCRKLTYTEYPPTDLEPGRFEVVNDPDYEFMD